jgi:hypothetical protein
MPRTPPPDALSRWLAAELSGLPEAESAADAALAELLGAQPLPAPPAGFADRVLARIEAVPAPWTAAVPAATRRREARRAPPVHWTVGVAAAALALAGVLWLPALLRALPALVSAGSIAWLLQAVIGVIRSASELAAGLVSVGNTVLLLVRAVAKPLATLPMAALALTALLVSVVALRLLYALIQRDRRWVYADPI